jgi:hypothetical protein
MVQRVKRWLQEGQEFRIVTARAARQTFDKLFHRAEKTKIEQWCVTHLGQVLPIQAQKVYSMIELWDVRVVQVEPNTGCQIGLSRVSVEAPDPLVAADVSSRRLDSVRYSALQMEFRLIINRISKERLCSAPAVPV